MRENIVQREPSRSIRTEIGMTKLMVALRNFVNAPKNEISTSTESPWQLQIIIQNSEMVKLSDGNKARFIHRYSDTSRFQPATAALTSYRPGAYSACGNSILRECRHL